MLRHDLPYHHDSAKLFSKIAHQPWAMFLDSGQALQSSNGQPGSQYGRYDILVANPIATLMTKGELTVVTDAGRTEVFDDDPFALINTLIKRYQTTSFDLPFAGGAVGYFSYDLARRLEKFDDHLAADGIPEMMIGIYDWAVVVDHRLKQSALVSHGLSPQTHQQWAALCALFDAPEQPADDATFSVDSEIRSNFTEAGYRHAFDKIKNYISAGDCYQVNLAQRFSAKVSGDAWVAYQQLRKTSPAPFMSFMQLPQDEQRCFQVLSNSPERFIQIVDGHVETRPIKGTRPRSKDPQQDLAYSEELLTSKKDQAENLMIVDLLRNDIGKSCEIGSVKADKLFQLQSFANVHHLVSIISGQLKHSATPVDLLRGCFPGGSITGAPKVRAMQIIDELEPNRRGLYCGAIGYIGFDGNMDTNIAIRTAVVSEGNITFYAGGGIVSDSMCENEYKETLDKASSVIAILKHFMKST